MKQPVLRKQQFKFIFPIQTRWSDNDQYGHVNNVMYYSFFDTAANALLIQKCGFDLKNSPTIGLVVNSQCDFMQELSYPEIIEVGVSIAKIGIHRLPMRWPFLNRIAILLPLKASSYTSLSTVSAGKVCPSRKRCVQYCIIIC